MNRFEQAKETVVAFLAGRWVSPEALDAALEILSREHPEILAELKSGMEAESAPISDCQSCLQHAPEIAQMSNQKLAQEMPTLARHLESCPQCQGLIESLRTAESASIWEVVKDTVTGTTKQPIAGIRAALNQAGQLVLGTGLPSLAIQPVAASMEEGSAGTAREHVWELVDTELDCRVRVGLVGCDGTTAELECAVTDSVGNSLAPERLHIELIQRATSRTLLAASFVQFRRSPPVLSAGKWLLKLKYDADDKTREWIIPIDLTSA